MKAFGVNQTRNDKYLAYKKFKMKELDVMKSLYENILNVFCIEILFESFVDVTWLCFTES